MMRALSNTPVAVLFREWQRVTVSCEDPALNEVEIDRLCDIRADLELTMNTTPSQTIEDVLMKVCATTDFGESVSLGGRWTGWAEARALIGGIAE